MISFGENPTGQRITEPPLGVLESSLCTGKIQTEHLWKGEST